ncbi:MAG: hypothetical protein KIS79_04125 [Burkholderiales bacterium]|nr:hypothetical protein [Burkholderiales bacterium]
MLAGTMAFFGGAVHHRAKRGARLSKWSAAMGATLHVIAAWILTQQMRPATAIFFVLTVSMVGCVALPYLAALKHADPK